MKAGGVGDNKGAQIWQPRSPSQVVRLSYGTQGNHYHLVGNLPQLSTSTVSVVGYLPNQCHHQADVGFQQPGMTLSSAIESGALLDILAGFIIV